MCCSPLGMMLTRHAMYVGIWTMCYYLKYKVFHDIGNVAYVKWKYFFANNITLYSLLE